MAERESPQRTCIVTREVRDPGDLIRFVVDPEGEVVPDIRRKLPGRGVHVTATTADVAMAERKHLFAKAFEGKVTVAPGLADRVGQLLETSAVQGLSLARKAGTAIFGFSKVEEALGRGTVVGLLHAAEAAEDGIAKLAQAARRAKADPAIIRAFSGEQLDLAFGRTNVIHAALLAGPASEHALARIRDFVRFRGDSPVSVPDALRTLTLDEPTDAPLRDL